MTLGLRIRFGEDEPPHGMAMRVATRHGAGSPDDFLRDHCLSLEGVASGRQSRALARLVGAPANAMQEMTIDVTSRTVSVAGETLLLNDWSLAVRRWCPRCFAEDRDEAAEMHAPVATACRHRPLWDLRSSATCPRHRVALEASCPGCGRGQDWNGPAVDRCPCGRDLATAAARPLGPQEGLCDAYVAGRLGAGPLVRRPQLDAAELKDALASVERLGWAVLTGRRRRPALVDYASRAIARDAGMAALADWPASIRTGLDRVLAERPADAPAGVLKAYGWIYAEWAYHPPRTELDGELRDELAAHAVAHSVVAAGEPLFGGQAMDTVTMSQAARSMAMDYSRARALLDERGAIPAGVRRGVAFPLRPEDVQPVAPRTAPHRVARDRLGVGRSQARQLSRAFSANGSDLDWIDALMFACRRSAFHVAEVPSGVVALPRACKAGRVGLAEACSAILEGRLRARFALVGDETLAGVLVRVLDVRALAPRGLVSVEAAATMLYLHHEAVRWLVSRGELAIRPGTKSPRLERASVLTFGVRHASAAALASELHCSTRNVTRALDVGGVVPVFGPPACRQRVYLRDEAMEMFGHNRAGPRATIH